MVKHLRPPRVNIAQHVVSILRGGTGTNNITEAKQNLEVVTNAEKGQLNGIAALGVSTKLLFSNFPPELRANNVSLSGTFQAYTNQVVNFTITDYDFLKTYNLSVDRGSAVRSGDTITFTAPTTAGNVTLTVNGRSLTFSILNPAPAQPTITSPTNNATNQGPTVNVSSSAFSALGDSSTHLSTDWQVATDAGFTSIAVSSIGDTTNKTSWSFTNLNTNTTYYLRCRYRGSNFNYSDYSPTITFTTKTTFIPQSEEAKLTASDKATNHLFGYGVAVDSTGTRVAVGAPSAVNGSAVATGAVYIFVRNTSNNTWSQEAKFWPSAGVSGDGFGNEVSMDSTGTRVVSGSPSEAVSGTSGVGAVYVFTRSGTTWTQEQRIPCNDVTLNANFGQASSISADGTRLISGSWSLTNNSGYAYIYRRSGTTWTLDQRINASDIATNMFFGYSFDIDETGTRVIVGAYNASNGTTNTGAAYVFLRSGTTWTQEQKLTPASGVSADEFGFCVSIDSAGTRVAVGSKGRDFGGTSNAGSVFVYTRSGSTWSAEAEFSHSDRATGDGLGTNKVQITPNGNYILVGCRLKNGREGAAYIFSRTGTSWTQSKKYTASSVSSNSDYGMSVAIASDGSRCVISQYADDPSGIQNAGSVYVYS